MVYNPRDYVSTSQAAKICSVSRVTVHNWIKCGKLSALKTPGGQLKISRAELDKFINGHFTLLNNEFENPTQAKSNKFGRLIIIDDDQRHCELLKSYLEEFLEVTIFNDVMSATSEIINLKPDLVLLDICMPEINGTSLGKFMKSHKDLEKVPIIVISALPEKEIEKSINNYDSSQKTDYFRKPVRLDQLRKKIMGKIGKS